MLLMMMRKMTWIRMVMIKKKYENDQDDNDKSK